MKYIAGLIKLTLFSKMMTIKWFRFISGNYVSPSYLVYRCIVALIFLVHHIFSLANYQPIDKYYIHATYWGHSLITLAVNLDAILVVARYILQAQGNDEILRHYEKGHWIIKISMVLTSVSYPWVLSVTAGYYSGVIYTVCVQIEAYLLLFFFWFPPGLYKSPSKSNSLESKRFTPKFSF